jgi:hypothetical protein
VPPESAESQPQQPALLATLAGSPIKQPTRQAQLPAKSAMLQAA